jgi:hypothetical protein
MRRGSIEYRVQGGGTRGQVVDQDLRTEISGQSVHRW